MDRNTAATFQFVGKTEFAYVIASITVAITMSNRFMISLVEKPMGMLNATSHPPPTFDIHHPPLHLFGIVRHRRICELSTWTCLKPEIGSFRRTVSQT